MLRKSGIVPVVKAALTFRGTDDTAKSGLCGNQTARR